jgi:hypothetical protein
MAMTEPPNVPGASSTRTLAFRIVAGILGFATVALTVPFTIGSFTNDADAIHRMHNTATLVTFGILIGVLLLLCAWRPEEQLVAFRVVGASSIGGAVAGLVSSDLVTGGSFVGAIASVVLFALHPLRERIFRSGAVHPEPLVLAVIAFIPGIAWTLTQANLQRHGVPSVDPHAELHHYSGMASVGLTVPLAAAVVCFGGTGRRMAATIVGGSWVLLGVSSLVLHDHVGAFDAVWSWWLIVGGAAFVALSEVAERRLDASPNASARPPR